MSNTFIVAEIGQNHNGNPKIAYELIDMAARCGVDAVKFCKRTPIMELTNEQFLMPYDNPNSFGETYGEHREYLEFTPEQHSSLQLHAVNKHLTYFVSVCDIQSAKLMKERSPIFKIPSRDISNLKLIKYVATLGKPMILSLGLATREDLNKAIQIIRKYHITNLTILNCTSEYPTKPEHLHLNRIKWLRQNYYAKIGHSDHTGGIWSSIAAVALGATTIEVHVTLSRMMKGTDHKGSLEELGLMRLVRDIRKLETAFGGSFLFKEHPDYLKQSKIYGIYKRHKQPEVKQRTGIPDQSDFNDFTRRFG